MRSPRVPGDGGHAEAAARRLAQLTADLGGRPAAPAPDGESSGAPEEEWWADHTRVVPPLAAEDRGGSGAPPAPSGPTPFPRPGRHAARRRLRGPLPRLPVILPTHVAVVAIVAAVAIALTAWWVVRDRSGPTEPVPAGEAQPLVAGVSGATTEAAAASGGGASGTVTVDVTGKVKRPGIVVLDAGARVVDAVDAAGGARPGVDLASLNLARLLVDGEQIVVGAPAAATIAPPPGGAPAVPGAPTAPVNLNLATPAELETLPDVGPVTAAAIVAWRDEHGGFSSVDELLEVDGIGDVTLEKLAPYVTV